jgi:hypothetical protein
MRSTEGHVLNLKRRWLVNVWLEIDVGICRVIAMVTAHNQWLENDDRGICWKMRIIVGIN